MDRRDYRKVTPWISRAIQMVAAKKEWRLAAS
jgi:hypothetical protein